jgi:hypothetical protein
VCLLTTGRGPARILSDSPSSAAWPSQTRDPWLCGPTSRSGCPCRKELQNFVMLRCDSSCAATRGKRFAAPSCPASHPEARALFASLSCRCRVLLDAIGTPRPFAHPAFEPQRCESRHHQVLLRQIAKKHGETMVVGEEKDGQIFPFVDITTTGRCDRIFWGQPGPEEETSRRRPGSQALRILNNYFKSFFSAAEPTIARATSPRPCTPSFASTLSV